MGILELIGLGFVYLLIGYKLGDIYNKEYFDNKAPTESLDILRKFKRLIMFPISYHNWHERLSNPPPITLLSSTISNDLINADEVDKRNYCKASALFWPTKAIPALLGLVQVIFFSAFKVLDATTLIPQYALKGAENGIGRLSAARVKLLPGSLSISSWIDEIGSASADSEKKTEYLQDKKTVLISRLDKLRQNRVGWQLLTNPSKSAKDMVKGVEDEIESVRQKISDIDSALAEIKETQKGLAEARGNLLQCKVTRGLKLQIASSNGGELVKADALAVFMSESCTQAEKAVQKWNELSKRIKSL